MKFRPFSEARDYVHKLGLKNQADWRQYCKSGKRPSDVPASPHKVYKKEWKGMGDWLGTGTIAAQDRVFRPFEEAREFVYSLGLRNQADWRQYCKSGKKPTDIPSNPNSSYKAEWKGYPDWLGTSTIANKHLQKYVRPFTEARRFVHALNLKSRTEWKKYCDSGQKPPDIPSHPLGVYKKEWKGMGDWLGTGTVATRARRYRPFEEARAFIRSLNLKGSSGWKKYRKSGKMPSDIPANPNRTYRNDWKGMGDWLGTGTIAPKDKEYFPFNEARKFVHSLGIKTQEEWARYCKSGKKPQNLPTAPDKVYEREWKGFGYWLGTGTIAAQERVFRPFEEAREFARSLGLKGQEEWDRYCQSGKKPLDIPAIPHRTYRNEWKGFGYWLGTGTIATNQRQYRPFEEAREFARSLKMTDHIEWISYCTSGQKPIDIPSGPTRVYEDEWVSWPDWLGYEEKAWSLNKVKGLLRDLISSQIIYQWNEAVLYSFLLRKGVLNLRNIHTNFFKNLIEARRTQEGRKAIEEYAMSDSEIPPELSKLTRNHEGGVTEDMEQEIRAASPEEVARLIEERDPLDYGETLTPEQILSHTNVLESINVDEEAMQFYLEYSIDELWKTAFRNEKETVLKVREEGKNGNKYHDTVVETFLSDYEGTRDTKIPEDYKFPHEPTLMQKYVAYKVKTNSYFGNFSGTGAGKTLSAVLASRVIDSKMTAIVCPNDVVEQWRKSILEIFPDSKVITGKESFYAKHDEREYKYLVLNYDKFSQDESPNLILNLVKQKIDFVVLDEIHFVKKRDEDTSQRRKNLDGLMTAVRKKNN